jgi:predicted small lipoprotein YifL
LKTDSLLKFIGSCLLLTHLSITVIGCGKKGDLIRPEPPEEKETQLEDYQEFFDKTENTDEPQKTKKPQTPPDDSQDNESLRIVN